MEICLTQKVDYLKSSSFISSPLITSLRKNTANKVIGISEVTIYSANFQKLGIIFCKQR